jgi:hypothetical protein
MTVRDNGEQASKKQEPKYIVIMSLGACNTVVALHQLYVEVLPYLLKGSTVQSGNSVGYRDISAMKDALSLVPF